MISTQYKNIHYYAQCENCLWDTGIFTEETPNKASVRRAIAKHIKVTGHTVTLSIGHEIVYKPNRKEN